MAALAKAWHQALEEEQVRLVLTTGEVLEGRIHESMRGALKGGLLGRCIDLRAAYKQLVVAPADWPASIVAMR